MRTITGILTALYCAIRAWYRGSIERQRRAVEEDARRLGGAVTWHDDEVNA